MAEDLNYPHLCARSEEAVSLLHTMASKPRLDILTVIGNADEASVGTIARATGMRLPTVSQHLSILRNVGAVERRNEGTTAFYSIKDGNVRQVMALLDYLSENCWEGAR